MPVDITIPSPGESVTEVVLGPWQKKSGEWVEKDEMLVEIESDKVTLEIPAPESGVLNVQAEEGDEKNVGDVIGSIDPNGQAEDSDAKSDSDSEDKKEEDTKEGKTEAEEGERKKDEDTEKENGKEKEEEEQKSEREAAPAGEQSQQASRNEVATETTSSGGGAAAPATSLARKIAADKGVDLDSVKGTGPSGRITKSDVLTVASEVKATPRAADSGAVVTYGSRGTRREKMTKLRQRIAERLVQAQQTAAMLTTFNEADMSAVMALRKQHKESFAERHGVGLGFMSFFVKACVSALQAFPRVNAYIIDDEIEYHDFVDISVAVGTDKGLVVPVLRNAETMTFAEVEETIKDFAERAHEGKLSIDEMTGGTFTVSNGGVYGSLNSTPILNPPQSAILGMHRIMNRPIEDPANPGQIVLRPMMYLALSYDHRIIDGAEAVSFLVHVKNCIEAPERLLLGL